jgi:hypothetical protein
MTLKTSAEKEMADIQHEEGYQPVPMNPNWPQIKSNYKCSYIEELGMLTYPTKNELHFWNTKT